MPGAAVCALPAARPPLRTQSRRARRQHSRSPGWGAAETRQASRGADGQWGPHGHAQEEGAGRGARGGEGRHRLTEGERHWGQAAVCGERAGWGRPVQRPRGVAGEFGEGPAAKPGVAGVRRLLTRRPATEQACGSGLAARGATGLFPGIWLRLRGQCSCVRCQGEPPPGTGTVFQKLSWTPRPSHRPPSAWAPRPPIPIPCSQKAQLLLCCQLLASIALQRARAPPAEDARPASWAAVIDGAAARGWK